MGTSRHLAFPQSLAPGALLKRWKLSQSHQQPKTTRRQAKGTDIEAPHEVPRTAQWSDPWLPLLLLLWGIMLHETWSGPAPAGRARVDPPPALSAVNPNVAPWWELAILRRVGFGLSQEIVDHRRSVAALAGPGDLPRAFWSAPDLQKVRGIGPRTVQWIADELHFAGPSTGP